MVIVGKFSFVVIEIKWDKVSQVEGVMGVLVWFADKSIISSS